MMSRTASLRWFIFTALWCALCWWVLNIYALTLRDPQWLSGWVLLALLGLLVLYHGRKKLNFLPILRNAIWLRWHLYLGVASALLFFFHTHWRWPTGILETVLWLLFVTIILSGVIGYWLTKWLPARLTNAGEQLIFERVLPFNSTLRQRGEDIVMQSLDSTASTSLVDFFQEHLVDFLRAPRFSINHLFNRHQLGQQLSQRLTAQLRYLNQQEKQYADELLALIQQKNQLDQQYTLQLLLKSWLFIHLPLTFGMLAFAFAHIVLVYGFGAA